MGEYKTFDDIASKLNLSTDQCQNIYYGRSKNLSKLYRIDKIED
jgi:hypothetical protein